MSLDEKKVALLAAALLFFVLMILLTLTARDVHKARLPRVVVYTPTYENFEENRRVLVLPMDIYTSNKTSNNQFEIYIIATKEINEEERNVVICAPIQVGVSNGMYFEVVRGLLGHELVVVSSDKPLNNGVEVFIVES